MALTDVGIVALAGALQAGALPSLSRLLISGTKVSDSAVHALGTALQRDRRVLRPSDAPESGQPRPSQDRQGSRRARGRGTPRSSGPATSGRTNPAGRA